MSPSSSLHSSSSNSNGNGLKDYGTVAKSNKTIGVQRSLSLYDGIMMIVGSIVGSGIFITPKAVFVSAGSVGAGLIVWLASGLFSMLGALCFMELGTSIGRSGGEYAYLLECFGPLTAYLHLWICLVVRQPTSLAIVALTFAQYVFKPFYVDCEPPTVAVKLLAASILLLVTYLNCTSVRWVMRVQSVFTAAKVLALLAIIAAGLVYFFQGHTENLTTLFEGETKPDMLALSFYGGLFAYIGWHFLNLVTEEMIDPVRNLPRAITISMIIVTFIYVSVNLAYIVVLPPDELYVASAVAVAFGNVVFKSFAWLTPLAVAISTIGAMNGNMFTSARVLLVGAQDSQLPSFLAMLDVNKCTPTPAIIITGFMSILMLLLADIYTLINYLSFSLWLTFGGCVAGLLWLRRTKPDMERPIKIHTSIPIIFVIGCIALLILPLIADPWNTSIGAGIIFTGFPAYYLQKLHQKHGTKSLDCFNRYLQKLLLVVSSNPHSKQQN
ncbi:b(0,+)-type amino acid transporter 1 [Chamberlinius hualienensis]